MKCSLAMYKRACMSAVLCRALWMHPPVVSASSLWQCYLEAVTASQRVRKQATIRNFNRLVQRIEDKDRPEEAFRTEKAVRGGVANAASGRIMVTVPGDWFGPIPAEHDPIRGTVSTSSCRK